MVLIDVAAWDGLARRAVLGGALAPEVGNMTALRALNLAGNAFSVRGTIHHSSVWIGIRGMVRVSVMGSS